MDHAISLEDVLRRSLASVLAGCAVLTVLAYRTPAAAQNLVVAAEGAIGNITVSRTKWHRGIGWLFGEVTISNGNAHSVRNVLIGCDFVDELGNPVSSKGIALRRRVPPGTTQFGIRLPRRFRNMQGGACHIVSAKVAAQPVKATAAAAPASFKIVPASVVDPNQSFFLGGGDFSNGSWSR